MAFNFSPRTVQQGLVLALDAGNVKSYPGSGTAWNDLSPNLNSGSLVASPTFDSANGGSLSFNGTTQYATLGTPSSLNILSNITINSWVNVTAYPTTITNWGTIYEKGYDNVTDQTYFRFTNYTGTAFIEVGTYKASNNTAYQTQYTIGSTISLGSWNNIVGQYDGANWNLFLNGRLVSQTLNNQPPLASTAPVSVGAAYISNAYARFLNGKIAVVQVYNRALSAGEVLQNYNALKGRFNLT